MDIEEDKEIIPSDTITHLVGSIVVFRSPFNGNRSPDISQYIGQRADTYIFNLLWLSAGVTMEDIIVFTEV